MSSLKIVLAFGALLAISGPALSDPVPQAPLQTADAARDKELRDMVASFLPPGVTIETATDEQLGAALEAAIAANPQLADELENFTTAAGPGPAQTAADPGDDGNDNTPEHRRGNDEEEEAEAS